MSTKPRKVSTGFKTASTPDFKTAKAAMTDAPPVTDQPEDKTTADDHVDCTQILNEEAAYEGPTQLNEDEEEEETPAVPRQTPSGTAGPPPPRPRFSYTTQSSTPPPPATAEATSAPDALRDVLATAPVQRAVSDASRHATAGDIWDETRRWREMLCPRECLPSLGADDDPEMNGGEGRL